MTETPAPKTERQLLLDSVTMDVGPAPEFRGAGMHLAEGSFALEGHASYRKDLDASPAKGVKRQNHQKKMAGVPYNKEYRLIYDLGNSPVEGAASVMYKG